MGSDFGNTGSCRRFYSCKTKKRERCEQCFLEAHINNNTRKICQLFRSCTDLLLRKQFWITLMMKEAASFSLKPGLNRCLNVGKEAMSNNRKSRSNCSYCCSHWHTRADTSALTWAVWWSVLWSRGGQCPAWVSLRRPLHPCRAWFTRGIWS